MKRAIIIVLDAVGIGELPDADKYGDKGSNTLMHVKEALPALNLKNYDMWSFNICCCYDT